MGDDLNNEKRKILLMAVLHCPSADELSAYPVNFGVQTRLSGRCYKTCSGRLLEDAYQITQQSSTVHG